MLIRLRRRLAFLTCLIGIFALINILFKMQPFTTSSAGPINESYILPFANRTPFLVNLFGTQSAWQTAKNCTKPITLLITINSSPEQSLVRQAIRETWARPNTNFFILFILGQPTTYAQLASVRKEQDIHGDLVVSNITEHFYNLPLKTGLALSWAHRHCPQTMCVLKTDSDVIVFPDNVAKLCRDRVKGLLPKPKIYGECWDDAPVRRNSSDMKTYVPKSVHPNKTYPMYCSGTGYLMTNRAVQALIKVLPSRPWPVNWLRNTPEDVTFTGILAQKASVKHYNIVGFGHHHLDTKNCPRRALYTMHSYRTHTMINEIWRKLETLRTKCWKSTKMVI